LHRCLPDGCWSLDPVRILYSGTVEMDSSNHKKRLSKQERKLLKRDRQPDKSCAPPAEGSAEPVQTKTKKKKRKAQPVGDSGPAQLKPRASKRRRASDPSSPAVATAGEPSCSNESAALRTSGLPGGPEPGLQSNPSSRQRKLASQKEAAAGVGVKKKKKAKDAKTSPSPEVVSIMRDLESPGRSASLSDRLNPTHSAFDKSLKANWKLFSKKERAMIVDCDKKVLEEAAKARVVPEYPFPVCSDDHCETGIESYRDIAPLLSFLATRLGKNPASLKIYDPFYCAGAVLVHLKKLGFESVYNKCEDFYAVVKRGKVPSHDVVVTNPPYSGDHVERLLKWCRSNQKPFLLLMPGYFCNKPYYDLALGGPAEAGSMLYLCPKKRYAYWTPKGLRDSDRVQAQHSGSGGNRTSPFVSLWYLDLAPAAPAETLLAQRFGSALCRRGRLPSTATEPQAMGRKR